MYEKMLKLGLSCIIGDLDISEMALKDLRPQALVSWNI
jgi:hypothetical protein